MNFDYIKEAEPSTDDLRQLYDSLYQNLEKAGIILDKTTEMWHDAAQSNGKNLPDL